MNDKYLLFSERFKNVFALTGGIGCGKSTVLSLFRNIGCSVIDSDKICHELYNKRDFTNTLIKQWGNLIITDGKVNRKKVADIVFKDNTELEWLNNIIHPEILKYALEAIGNCTKEIVIFDVPLLFELKLESLFKATIAVWTNARQQHERLKNKNNWSDKEIKSRLDAQLSPDIKLEKAVYGIINTGNLDFLETQCKKIFFKIKKETKQQ